MTDKIKTRYTRAEVLNRVQEYVRERAPIGYDGGCVWEIAGARCVVGCLLEPETLRELEKAGMLGVPGALSDLASGGAYVSTHRLMIRDVTGVEEINPGVRARLSALQGEHDEWAEDVTDWGSNWEIPLEEVREKYMELLDGALEYREE